jgi:hypothetical protein
MAAININQDGVYAPSQFPNIDVVGVGFSFALTGGGNWSVSVVSNAPNGPDKFYLTNNSADGIAIEEVLQGKPPGGIATGQGQNHWISGNNGTANTPQIDYILDATEAYLFKVINVLTDNLIEIEYPGGVTDGTDLVAPFALYTKGVQIDELNFNIDGIAIQIRMDNDNTTAFDVLANTIMSFQVGSGPIIIYSPDVGSFYQASFKKSLERLS